MMCLDQVSFKGHVTRLSSIECDQVYGMMEWNMGGGWDEGDRIVMILDTIIVKFDLDVQLLCIDQVPY